jgi:hypothetical protein
MLNTDLSVRQTAVRWVPFTHSYGTERRTSGQELVGPISPSHPGTAAVYAHRAVESTVRGLGLLGVTGPYFGRVLSGKKPMTAEVIERLKTVSAGRDFQAERGD